jgi:hypothetical protein
MFLFRERVVSRTEFQLWFIYVGALHLNPFFLFVATNITVRCTLFYLFVNLGDVYQETLFPKLKASEKRNIYRKGLS